MPVCLAGLPLSLVKFKWRTSSHNESVGTPKFRVGNRVRISKAKRHFEKWYMANWTDELLFTIVDAHRSHPPVYRLADCHGDKLDGTFYEPELLKVVVPKGKTYRVESILRWRNMRRREVLVVFGKMVRVPHILQQLDRCKDSRQLLT